MVSLGPGLSNQSCTHSLPRSWVEGCVVQLCEARGFMDEGRAVMIPWAMCTGVSCQSKEGSLGW